MTLNEIANFLGWCTLINFGLLILSTTALVVGRNFVANLHAKWFEVDAADLRKSYFQYLANYKLLVLVFNLVPYLALRILAN
ncbi:hypothetical protein LF1_47810 [Rubripirellula obstinata]|uniref:DUF6868 domain-containing protein n=1 Tax=Rubripirellula obstinata TaxID=406547 RepID=A0A5B1CQU3_9BACT|nr:hypothetical protein [Rubripirellula obstinata]KAA1262219.1 hypothetical protein LF1_47810 [Rubripirellula obstinata]